MTSIKKSALVKFSALQMFKLVNDIAAYPDFLPWCAGSRIVKREHELVEAELQIYKAGFQQSFITQNRSDGHSKLFITLVDGPFSSLDGVWSFMSLRKDASKISLDLEFEMQGKLANLAFGTVFAQVCNTMVSSFTHRAKQIYG